MKKIYLSIIITLLFYGYSIAQPTFTVANWSPVGTMVTNTFLDSASAVPGNAGANQTWNFSSATATGGTSSGIMVDPSTTPFAGTFPTANAAFSTIGTGGSSGFAYYTKGAAMAEMVGVVSDNGTFVNSLNYSDRRTLITFPFTYQSTFTDNYSAFSSYVVSGIQVDNYRSGNCTVTADAWGNLTAPNGTFNNVLRTITDETTIDSSVTVGFSTLITTNIVSYGWSDPNRLESVLSMSFVSIDIMGSVSNSTSFQYSDFTSGISEMAPMKPLEIFPNPAGNNTVVHLTADDLSASPTTFVATNAEGKEVKRINFKLQEAAHKTVDIDMSDCASGIYFIRLEQKNSIFTSRFVKQ